MTTPPNPSTQPVATIDPAGPHGTPAPPRHDTLADNNTVLEAAADVAYVAWLFARTARMAERAIRAAAAAELQVPGWAESTAWLYDYHAWTLGRTATPDAGANGTAAPTAPAPHGGGR